MNLEKLLIERKIQEIEKENPDFKDCDKDLISSENNFRLEDYEWSTMISYNSVLRASIKLMCFLGYRPIGKEHHKNVFEFLKQIKFNKELVNYFDKVRIKRNQFIYCGVSVISKKEAREILDNAKKFVREIKTYVLKNRTKEDQDE